ISKEDNQWGDVPPETPDELTPTPNATPNAASAQGGDPTITLPAERDEGEASLSSTTPKNSHTEVTRFSMRNEDNKLILDNQVLLSVLEVDSLDKTATVRVHFLDTEARETRNMGLGDSFVIERKEKNYRLLLDQLKGSQAVFLLIEL
ncbi:MAG: hypothetical protein LBF22_12700, partial [Deltaproteobacteria bacterium]|nr:hypothetical protein [Deltaproteobacteria bacterium]